MKITLLAGALILASLANARAAASADPLKCRTHDGAFDMNDTDFAAIAGAIKKPDNTWANTPEEAKEAFMAKPATSDVRASICQTRMLARMLANNDPRAATPKDISSSGPYSKYSIAYFSDSELPAVNQLLNQATTGAFAGGDASDSPFRFA